MDEKALDIAMKVKDLFKRYGIKSVTMDDVSHELGISKKTLYEHFSDKMTLVKAVVDCEAGLREKYFEQNISDTGNAIDEMIKIYRFYQMIIKEHNPSFEYDLKKYYPDIFNGLKKLKREKIKAITLANLKRGKAEGVYRADLDEEIIARLYVLRIESMMETDLFSPEEMFSEHFSRELFAYHLFGVVSEKGYKYLVKNIGNIEIK